MTLKQIFLCRLSVACGLEKFSREIEKFSGEKALKAGMKSGRSPTRAITAVVGISLADQLLPLLLLLQL